MLIDWFELEKRLKCCMLWMHSYVISNVKMSQYRWGKYSSQAERRLTVAGNRLIAWKMARERGTMGQEFDNAAFEFGRRSLGVCLVPNASNSLAEINSHFQNRTYKPHVTPCGTPRTPCVLLLCCDIHAYITSQTNH